MADTDPLLPNISLKEVTDIDNMTFHGLNHSELIQENDSDDEISINPSTKTKMTCRVYVMTFLACIGGFLFGYDTGVVSGAMVFITRQFSLDAVWTELIVSVTVGAAALFALLGGVMNDRFGRKPTILIASVIFTVGSVTLGIAPDKYVLICGRAIVGAGIGLASMTVPVYIAEAAPPSVRGRIVTMYTLFITFGQFVASVVDGLFSSDTENGWRYMLGLAAIPSMVQLIGFFFMPESPRWLLSRGKVERAREVLQSIRREDNIELELESISAMLAKSQQSDSKGRNVFVSALLDPVVRKAIIVGCGLQMFQQISGINTVMYYSATIIKLSGVKNDSSAVWLASLTAATNFLFTFVGLYLVEKIGRRTLIISSQIGVVLSLIALGVGFNLASIFSPSVSIHLPGNSSHASQCNSYKFCDPCISDTNCGYCYIDKSGSTSNGSCLALANSPQTSAYGPCNQTVLHDHYVWATDYCPTQYSWMAVFGLVLYLAFFAPGMGPMPWTINSEIYPLWARSTGVAAATATNWIFNLIISMTFLSLTMAVTRYGAFYLYAGLAFLGLIFTILVVPETKGKRLEEVQELFRKPWSCC